VNPEFSAAEQRPELAKAEPEQQSESALSQRLDKRQG
jgi:hypothetical protein